MNDESFIIGDVHGKARRLQVLLEKSRARERGAEIVQLGDLGHFGEETLNGDYDCWNAAFEGQIDKVIWGNHDRATVDRRHMFNGYAPGSPVMHRFINPMERNGRLVMAYASHGWLVTHAGLHIQFDGFVERNDFDVVKIAEWLNDPKRLDDGVINAVGRTRGGPFPYGGILWRDISEPLATGIKQIFGHSASREHEIRGEQDSWWCIDIGGKPSATDPGADALAGIFLPSQEIVRVGPEDL